MKIRHRRLLPLAGALVLAGAGTAAFLPHGTHAAVGIKHTGPILTLSNGRTVQVLASISDSQSNIKEIDYTIHGPSGTRELKVAFQKAWGGLINRAYYVADQASGTYTTDTYVKTVTLGTTNYAVSAQSVVTHSTTKKAASSTGTENAHITVKLTA
jgi:hypothetical protein